MIEYQIALYALIGAFVVVFWKASQWALASARATKEAESLTPGDLDALREACEFLITDLRAAADESTAQIELAIRKAEIITDKLNQMIPMVMSNVHIVEDTEVGERPLEITLNGSAVQNPEMAREVVRGHNGSRADFHEEDEDFNRIYQLSDMGASISDIARSEGKSPGEIKLILDLRNMQSRPNAA